MKIRLSFALPCGLLLFALLYGAFTLSLETERMIGDSFGYDPGSRLIPLLAAGILGLVMSIEMVRAARNPVSTSANDATPLVLINIVAIVAFIGAFRYLGFLPTTALTLFLLIAFNLHAVRAGWTTATFFKGAVLTLVYATVVYSAVRGAVRACFALAREMQLPLFRDPALQGGIATAVLVLVLVLSHRLARRSTAIGDVWMPVQVSVGATMTVFVVFRLFFLVQLPQGVIWW